MLRDFRQTHPRSKSKRFCDAAGARLPMFTRTSGMHKLWHKHMFMLNRGMMMAPFVIFGCNVAPDVLMTQGGEV